MRTCVGCRRRADPAELIRVFAASGVLDVGPGPGRGAWLCRGSAGCFDQATRHHAFDRALRRPVSPDAVRALRRLLVPSSDG